MNKFLTTTESGISESDVKKIIDLNCVTYDSKKNVSIQNDNDEILYTLPKTTAPAGYVVAAGSNGNLIFTNSPIPDQPYLVNPLESDLILNSHNILGANEIRPNTLVVATNSILPIINGVTRFTDIIKVNTIQAATGNFIDLDAYFRCNSILTNNIAVQGTDDILTIAGPVTCAYNISSASMSTNTLSTRYGQSTLTISANRTTASGDIDANKMLVNTISTRSGSVLTITAGTTTMNDLNTQNVSLNALTCNSGNVAGTLNTTTLKTNSLGARSQTYISVTNDISMNENNLLCKYIGNVNRIEFVQQSLQPITALYNLMLIQSDSSIDLSPTGQVNVNSDLDMKQHVIKNANFEGCDAIDILNASVAGIDEMHNDVITLKSNVDSLQITTTSNSHRLNTAENHITTLLSETAYNTISINNLHNDMVALSTHIDENKSAINELDTTTQSQSTSITNLDGRLTIIESNVTNINNTVSQKSIAPKQFTLTLGLYRSISDLDSSYTSNTGKNIDIIPGACYNIDYSFYLTAVNGSSITLYTKLLFGSSYGVENSPGSLNVDSYFINICYSFVIISYNPTSKQLALMLKCNTTYTSANSPTVNRTLSWNSSTSGTNNDIDINNNVVLDIGVRYTGATNTIVNVTRNFGVVNKII